LSTYTNHSKATYVSLVNYDQREIGSYVHTNTTSRPAGHVSGCFIGEKLLSETPETSAEESSAAAKESSCPPVAAFSSLCRDIGVVGKGIIQSSIAEDSHICFPS
jgi:hypothetical protein